jgi:channel protein (hemolysin III family)
VCAATGIFGHLAGLPGAVELVTYALMGWMVTPFLPTLVENMHPTGFRLVVAGGCIYTSGIYFFVTGGCAPQP